MDLKLELNTVVVVTADFNYCHANIGFLGLWITDLCLSQITRDP